MGSLLPGWDERAPGVAPKEFQDFNEQEEQLGYFASYNKMKQQREQGGDQLGTSAPGLSRRLSMPIGRNSMPLSSRDKDAAPVTPTFGSFKAPAGLQRLNSLPVTAGERFDMLSPKTPKSPLSSVSPHCPNLEAYKTHHEQQHETQWWRNFDSAHLNEMPDVPVNKEKGYTPQYKVAGQKMHYRGLTEEGNSQPDNSQPDSQPGHEPEALL